MKRLSKCRRAALLGVVTAGLIWLLTACSGSSNPEDLFALPQPPEDYRNLNEKIEEVLRDTGGESTAPISGSNTQTVQLQDLDGDGFLESAVAFFRVSGDEKPLKIYIFRLQPDDSYELDTVIDGVGTSIYSVSYENVGGSAAKEVIVSWQISTTVHNLGVYSTYDVEGIELLWVEGYTRFRMADLDGDDQREIVVATLQTDEETVNRADYYDYDGGALALKSTASLSAGIREITSVRLGALTDTIPAVFVTSGFVSSNEEGEETRGQVVDVLVLRDGVLTNATLTREAGMSEETVRYYTNISGQDINLDGIMELPRPYTLPTQSAGERYWLVEWRQFDLAGTPRTIMTTYHNDTDGWYFEIPEEWTDHITLSRRSASTGDERWVTFSRWKGEDTDPEPFLVIFKLTGTNQTRRASLGNRQTITTDSSATYAFEVLDTGFGKDLTKEEIIRRFHLIRSEWSTDY